MFSSKLPIEAILVSYQDCSKRIPPGEVGQAQVLEVLGSAVVQETAHTANQLQ